MPDEAVNRKKISIYFTYKFVLLHNAKYDFNPTAEGPPFVDIAGGNRFLFVVKKFSAIRSRPIPKLSAILGKIKDLTWLKIVIGFCLKIQSNPLSVSSIG